MSNFKNRTFTNVRTGKTSVVVDQNGDVAILDDGDRVSTTLLATTSIYEETIDPASFFERDYVSNIMADSIKSIPDNILHNISDDTLNNVIVNDLSNNTRPSYNTIANNDSAAYVVSDNEAHDADMASLYEKIKRMTNGAPNTGVYTEEASNEEVDSFLSGNRGIANPNTNTSNIPVNNIQHNTQVNNPIYSMFSGVKRKVDFSFNLTIDEKIPRIDFIEMMEDSYSVSIIDYLSEEFTNRLLSDPSIIKKLIKEELLNRINGGDVKLNDKPKVTKTTNTEDKQPSKRKYNRRVKDDEKVSDK